MAVFDQAATVFLRNSIVLGFSVSGIDLTGRVVKFSLAAMNPRTGAFDWTCPVLVKSSETAGHMTRVDDAAGEIDVNLLPADTGGSTLVGPGDYKLQLEVFDGAGANGIVVSEGVLTFLPNIEES